MDSVVSWCLSRGLYHKTFYGRNLIIFVISRVFVLGKLFQYSLVFVGMAGDYPILEHLLHNYSTKTSQAACVNGQSIYFLMSMAAPLIHNSFHRYLRKVDCLRCNRLCLHWQRLWNYAGNSDSHHILALATLGNMTQIRLFLFLVVPPKVAKASTVTSPKVTVACLCHWRFC